jgi:cobalamin biosynthesis protein CobD/CbiB
LHLDGFAAEYHPGSFGRHPVTIMGSLKKRRKAKINKHKRRKKLPFARGRHQPEGNIRFD